MYILPFSSIADSLVTVTDDEIKNYVTSHKEDYKSEASRNISFVKFDIKATPEDEEVIKADLKKLINDREEYSSAAKSNVKITGFFNTTDDAQFFRDNNSDTPLDEAFYTKVRITPSVKDTIFSFNKGEVYGPYKDGEYFKLTKVSDIKAITRFCKITTYFNSFLRI